jgi:diguanylate cyclase (GGDEF)-like protein/PAS domain S-box-containing protein
VQPDGRASKEKAREILALASKNGNYRFEWQHANSRQELFWCEVLLTTIPAENRTLQYVVIRDISARKDAEQSLRLAATAFENSHEGILIADKDQRIILVNRALSEITGYAPEEVLGNRPQDLYHSMQNPALFRSILDALDKHNHWQGELWGRHRSGRDFPFLLSITVVRDDHDEIINYIANLTDISERKAAVDRMQHMIEHDPLTGLPNRILLLDRLRQAIAAAQRNGTKVAVLFLDLDRFKNINDSFGHHVGDKLLQTVAERLRKCVRNFDTVSRLGGDEFVVMLADVGDGEPTAHIAENILNAINVPYSIDGNEFNISTCIGIASFPDDSKDSDALLKNADLAMYHAKDNGANSYQFFDDDMNTRMIERITLENNLRSALARDEFILHYQPQLNIASAHTVGAEALIRWQHPTLGLVFPDRFIRVAEECGMIVPIGDWVLRTACRQAKTWQAFGRPIVVAVNLSVAQFYQKDLVQRVTDALQAAELDPQYLELEITESILMDEEKPAIDTLHALKQMGVKIAIDDFGTGYSSLSYLKHIPIDKLKIDQSFVHDIHVDVEDAAIINAIIVMAKGLHLKVIAEGVETREQVRFLQAHGCDEYQGHYSSTALQPQAFLDFLETS